MCFCWNVSPELQIFKLQNIKHSPVLYIKCDIVRYNKMNTTSYEVHMDNEFCCQLCWRRLAILGRRVVH